MGVNRLFSLKNLSELQVLFLDNNRLTGSIPSELSELSKLRHLVLSVNQLTGTIPPELANLSNLQEFSIPANQITGTIPPAFTQFNNLGTFRVSDNKLTGTLHNELFANNPGLHTLWLQNNLFTGAIPIEITDLISLTQFLAGGNSLTGSLPTEMNKLVNLEILNLEQNYALTGTLSVEAADLPDLTQLRLSGTNLVGDMNPSGNLGQFICAHTALEKLSLGSPNLTGTPPPCISGLTNLDYLHLNFIGEMGPSEIPPWISSDNFDKLEWLILSGPNLTGTIPISLSTLQSLEHLQMVGSRLTGTIPSELNQLTNLQRLYIYQNRSVSGSIPDLGASTSLTNLTNLRLYSNNLTGSIPATIDNLPNLQVLFLADNQLTGPIPASLSNLTHLEWLLLRDNLLSGEIPQELCQLTKLERLTLGGKPTTKAPLTGTIPICLDELQNLVELTVVQSDIAGEIPLDIAGLSKLATLNLTGNRLTGLIPQQLGSLDNLHTLYLGVNQLAGTVPDSITQLPSMTSFSVAGNNLTGPLPQSFTNGPNLIELALGVNQFNGSIPDTYEQFSNLEILSIGGSPTGRASITGEFPSWIPSLNELSRLWISHTEISGTIPATIGNLTKISTLTISDNELAGPIPESIIDVGREIIIQPTNNSISLDISQNRLITLTNEETKTFLDTYSQNWTTQKAPFYIQLVDELDNPIANETVNIHVNNSRIITATTDSDGLLLSERGTPETSLQQGDEVVVLWQRDVITSPKEMHDDWIYHVYLSSMTVLGDGNIEQNTVDNYGRQRIVMHKDNPLILLNLVVSVDRDIFDQEDILTSKIPPFSQNLAEGFRSASDFLYDVTDGQMALGRVSIYDGGQHWQHADVHVLSDNSLRPNAEVGGFFVTNTHMYLGQHWDKFGQWSDASETDREWQDPDGYRTIVHELGHYVLKLYDAYEDSDSGKPTVYCDTIMGWHYEPVSVNLDIEAQKAFILSMRGVSPWTVKSEDEDSQSTAEEVRNCEQTYQWKHHQKSDWETVRDVFGDTQEPPRWMIRTPITGSVHISGPVRLPLDVLQIDIDIPEEGTRPETIFEPIEVQVFSSENSAPTEAIQAFAIQGDCSPTSPEDDPSIETITYLGVVDADGRINAKDIQPCSRILFVSTDGNEITSTLPSDDTELPPVQLEVATWNPVATHAIFDDWTGFGITATIGTDVDPSTLQMHVVEAGGLPILSRSMDPSSNEQYHKTVCFDGTSPSDGECDDQGRPVKNGNILLTVENAERSQKFDYVTNFSIRDWPGARMTQHAPIEIDSMDGNFRMSIPITSIVKTNVQTESIRIMVMPIRGTRSVSGTAASLNVNNDLVVQAAAASDLADLPIDASLTQVGSLYNVRASHNITQLDDLALLTLYYGPNTIKELEAKGLSTESLRIFYWNEDIAQWEDEGGAVQPNLNGQSVSTKVDRFGIYGIMVRTSFSLQSGQNAFVDPGIEQPVESALASCANRYSAVYNLVDSSSDDWSKYVVGTPAYVSNLENLQPTQEYQIIVNQNCELNFVQSDQVTAASLAEPSFVPFAGMARSIGDLPPLPAGFYGTVPADSTQGDICFETTDCRGLDIRNEPGYGEVYTVDASMRGRDTNTVTIETNSSNVVQEIAESGITKEENLDPRKPEYSLFLPVALR